MVIGRVSSHCRCGEVPRDGLMRCWRWSSVWTRVMPWLVTGHAVPIPQVATRTCCIPQVPQVRQWTVLCFDRVTRWTLGRSLCSDVAGPAVVHRSAVCMMRWTRWTFPVWCSTSRGCRGRTAASRATAGERWTPGSRSVPSPASRYWSATDRRLAFSDVLLLLNSHLRHLLANVPNTI